MVHRRRGDQAFMNAPRPKRKTKQSGVFVVLNPISGSCDAAVVRQALETHFPRGCEVYETTGQDDETLAEIAHRAVERGFNTVVAAGGDGTVSDVAKGLIRSDASLGVIATGTANVFARELGLPLDAEA